MMESIRDDFINKIETSARDANGVYVLMQIGSNTHAIQAKKHPNGKYYTGVGNPNDPSTRFCIYTPSNQAIQTNIKNNKTIIFEMYLTEIVQHWFEFLTNLYSFAVSQNIDGLSNFIIPKSKINIDYSLSSNDLIEWIKSESKKDFDFKSSEEKLRILRKMMSKDFREHTNDISVIKTNIQVRNILQHKNRLITQEDLIHLGKQYIELDEGNKITQLLAGDKVTRTAFDIENFVVSLIKIAKLLV